MRVFKVRNFARWAKKEKITNRILKAAVAEMKDGLIEADLGGGLVKKRIAVRGRGKRGGARIIVAFKTDKNVFFLFGFLKNEKENIDKVELKALKQYADVLFEIRDQAIEDLIKQKNLFEVR